MRNDEKYFLTGLNIFKLLIFFVNRQTIETEILVITHAAQKLPNVQTIKDDIVCVDFGLFFSVYGIWEWFLLLADNCMLI